MGSEDSPAHTDFTYSWQIIATPSEAAEESESYIPYVEQTEAREMHVEGPIPHGAWMNAVEAAAQAFFNSLSEELSEHELDDLSIEREDEEE